MAQIWNRYNSDRQSFGGGVPVWVKIPDKKITGGMLKNTIKDMEVLASGSPVEYDIKLHTAKILKCFEITATSVAGADTVITLKRTKRTPALYAGMNVMVEPATLTGTGNAAAITAVNESTENSYIITIPTASIGAVTVGKFLMEADGAGAGKKLFAIPTELTLDDTVGGDQNTVGIPVGDKRIYENMIPAMPKIVKDNLKGYDWEFFPETNA